MAALKELYEVPECNAVITRNVRGNESRLTRFVWLRSEEDDVALGGLVGGGRHIGLYVGSIERVRAQMSELVTVEPAHHVHRLPRVHSTCVAIALFIL